MPRNPFRSNIPVLCYHQVSPAGGHHPEAFEAHLQALVEAGYQTVGLRDLTAFMTGDLVLPARSVVLTFDDCTLDNWHFAIPLLRRQAMTGVFFAATDFIAQGPARPTMDQAGPEPRWLSAPEIFTSALRRNDLTQFMNTTELNLAANTLDMEVYSHTRTHRACFVGQSPTGTLEEKPHWSHTVLLPPDARADTPVFAVGSAYARDGFWFDAQGRRKSRTRDERFRFCLEEFTASKARIQEITAKDCPFLCWPWGQWDDLSLEAARQAGYRGALTLERGANSRGSDPFRIRRIGVASRKDHRWLSRKLRVQSTWLGATLFA